MYFNAENGYEMYVCPICGEEIEPYDGCDDGYGTLELWWECEKCGTHGTAYCDYHNQEDFYYHTVDNVTISDN